MQIKNTWNHRMPLENKSYYGGIYIYFMNQKLLKSKNGNKKPVMNVK